MTQRELAQLVGATQATVSRWEAGELQPGLDDLQKIRDHAKRVCVPWDDSLIFTPPPETGAAA